MRPYCAVDSGRTVATHELVYVATPTPVTPGANINRRTFIRTTAAASAHCSGLVAGSRISPSKDHSDTLLRSAHNHSSADTAPAEQHDRHHRDRRRRTAPD